MDAVKNNANFASRFRGLCSASDQTALANALNVTKNTFRQWTSGNATPTIDKLVKLSEYFGVSTDYLLGLSEVKAPDATIQAAWQITGLSEAAIKELSSMPTPDDPFGIEHDNAMSRQVETITYRTVVNLLLTNARGKKALKLLTRYYFATIDTKGQETSPAFVLPWELPDNGGVWIDTAIFTEDLQRGILLDLIKDELRDIARDRENASIINDRIRTLEEQRGRPLTDKERQKEAEGWLAMQAPISGLYDYITRV
jgi:transcriptional regulator with XRE-family HTH domain